MPFGAIEAIRCPRPWRSFCSMKSGGFALISVRCGLPGFFCRTKKIDEPAEIDVDHRRGVEGQELRQQQSADDGDAERAAQLRSSAGAKGERQTAEQSRHGG